MKLRFLLLIAVKNIIGKKMRSVLTVGGVVFGISAIVFLVSLGYGLERLVVNRIIGFDALRIIDVTTVKSQIIKLNEDTRTQFQNMNGISSVELEVNLPGRIDLKGSKVDVVAFGANTEYLKLAAVKAKYGSTYANDSSQILVNTSLLKLVGVDSDKYTDMLNEKSSVEFIILEELQDRSGDTIPVKKSVVKEVEISGIVQDDSSPIIYFPLQLVVPDGIVVYSQAKVQVKDQGQIDITRNNLESLGFSTASAADTVSQIEQMFTIFRVIVGGFGAIGLIVASMGMFNTLTVSLLERTREIGLMKALGAKKRDIFKLFLVESLLISGIGGIIGVFVGYGIGVAGNALLSRLALATGNEPVAVFYTPVVFILFIVIFSLVVGYLTGLYPSRRAGGLNPLDALRYE